MPALSYGLPLTLKRGSGVSQALVRDFQRDLRRLGYLHDGIDGDFGSATESAVRALQHDLLHNFGTSSGGDGPAVVRLVDYNRGRVKAVTGEADQNLVACISDILDDPAFPKLPAAEDPRSENRKIVASIAALPPEKVPILFLMAILKQESGLRHFNEPPAGDDDTYVTVGLDRNTGPDAISSRGYGAGQYTLFHHPPRPEEVTGFITSVQGNLVYAASELAEKFRRFVNGHTPGTRADDRIAECGSGPLRVCRYRPGDPRYLRNCKQCLAGAGAETRFCTPTQYYAESRYDAVPVRSRFGCDWPYAVRRYNGSGTNSYHYQARVLKHLAALP